MSTQPLATPTLRPLNLTTFYSHLVWWGSTHGLTLDDFSVSHGGSLLLLGLTDSTNDIDLTVDQELFDRFDNGKYRKVELSNGRYLLQVGRRITLHTCEIPSLQLAQCLVKHPNGIWFRNQEQTLLDYQALKRPQDKEKIKLLQEKKGFNPSAYAFEVMKDLGISSQFKFANHIGKDPSALNRQMGGKIPFNAKTLVLVIDADPNPERREKALIELENLKRQKRPPKVPKNTEFDEETAYRIMYIREVIRESKMSKSQFAEKINYCKEHLFNTLNGRLQVTPRLITQVEKRAKLTYPQFKQRLVDEEFEKWRKELSNTALVRNLVDYFEYEKDRTQIAKEENDE